jgi:hypothetical protein
MAEYSAPTEQNFSAIVSRIFSDPSFASAMEQDPEKALRDAGFKLDDSQVRALASAKQTANVGVSDANVAAFVRPVVSVLTKGTRPVTNVITQSAVLASSAQSKEENR